MEVKICHPIKIYYWISVPVLAEIEHTSEAKVRKVYKKVIRDECIPLCDIPLYEQEIYVKEYLFHDRYIDYSLLDFVRNFDTSSPLFSPEVQLELHKMEIVRTANMISRSYSVTGTSTELLRKLAQDNSISFSTLARWRKKYMKDKSLALLSDHFLNKEGMVVRYRTCCYYCRDLIILMKCKPGKISGAKIFRDISAMKPFSCSSCPYHPDVKSGPHKKNDCIPEATCRRNSEYMVVPNNVDVVWTIIKRIPEQQKVLEWEGVRSWANQFHYTPAREKSKVANECFFSDHKQLESSFEQKEKKMEHGKQHVHGSPASSIVYRMSLYPTFSASDLIQTVSLKHLPEHVLLQWILPTVVCLNTSILITAKTIVHPN